MINPPGNANGCDRDARGIRDRVPALYQDCLKIAHRMLRKFPANSMATGDLASEGLVKLINEEARKLAANQSGFDKKSDAFLRACFAAACRDVMSVRHRKRQRRGEVELTFEPLGAVGSQNSWLEVDELLNLLGKHRPKLAAVVELRVMGLTIGDCAEALNVSSATVDRRWRLGREWMREMLKGVE